MSLKEQNQYALLKQRRFAPFFATQFLGAFNDNVFRNGLMFLVAFQGITIMGLGHSELANVAGALFILPFLLFSAISGQFAEKYEKSMLMRRIKILEIALMTVAAFAFVNGAYGLLLGLLFLMGCQSTLFGPVKYAYLPQNLADDELIGGNALVEAGTYMAVILGLIVGGYLAEIDAVLVGCSLVVFAMLGYLTSRQVPVTKPADPDLKFNWNVWRETWRIVGFAREKQSVFLSILGISWFWFYGSIMTLQVPAYTVDILNGSESVAVTLLVAFIVGVSIGALLCERLSGRRIELGLVPLGSIGLSVFALDLYFAQPVASTVPVDSVGEFLNRPGSFRVLFDLAMIGAFGGIYSVPLYAMVQQRSKPEHMSRIIAANNIVNSIFMVSAAGLSILVLRLGYSIPELFLVVAALNVLVAIYIYTLLPEFLLRFFAWIIITVVYRLRVTGADNIPARGPAVVVCNHVSFMDPILLSGSIRRPMRFVMYYKIFEIPFLKFFFQNMKAIPIASAREDEALMEDAFIKVEEELKAGNIVCIFPEGGITRDGEIQRFRPGIERIIESTPVPVVPVSLGRLWGSWFSRHTGGGVRKLPGRLFSRVPIHIGEPVKPADVTAAKLELLVRTLRGDDR